MSSQWGAVASQNFTCPVVTGVVPATTVAVSVTTVPLATVVTALPLLATASVVVVATAEPASAGKLTASNQASARNITLPAMPNRISDRETRR
jgi:hypothetical protein